MHAYNDGTVPFCLPTIINFYNGKVFLTLHMYAQLIHWSISKFQSSAGSLIHLSMMNEKFHGFLFSIYVLPAHIIAYMSPSLFYESLLQIPFSMKFIVIYCLSS